MSSVASHVHAASSFVSSRQPQVAGSAPDADSDAFSAMFEAMASGQDPTATPGTTQAQPDTKPASAPTNGSTDGNSKATDAKTTDQTADQSTDTTSPASGSPGATSSTDNQIFTATTGGNLIQAAAVKAAGAGDKPGTSVAFPSPADGKGKSGAGSIADKLSKILAAASLSAASLTAASLTAASLTAASHGGDATTNTSTQTQASASSTANPDDSGNAVNTAAPGATDVAGIIAAVKAALSGSKPQQITASDSPEKTPPSASSKDSSADSSNSAQDSAGANATASAPTQQPAVQPIAAAITVNSQISAPPASGNTSADVQVGDSTKSRARFAMASADGKDGVPAQTTNDTGSAKQPAAAGNPELKAGKQSSANNSSNAQAPDSSDAQQSQPTTDNTSPGQLPGTVPSAAGDPPSPHAETFAAAVTSDSSGSTGSQTASTSAKVDATGLPNFGISAAAASAPSTGTAASATTNASNTVPVAGLAVAIASRAQAGSSQFDIRMDPPELGRIEVRLGIDRDGRVTSHVTVDRADTLQLLQDQQPQLQQALDQAGLKTADNGLQFSLRDQSFAGQQNNGGNGTQQNTAQLVIPDADLPTVQSAQIYRRLGLGTGVDISV